MDDRFQYKFNIIRLNDDYCDVVPYIKGNYDGRMTTTRGCS